MKHFTTYMEPAREVTALHRITCDLCGQAIRDEGAEPSYYCEEVVIRAKFGNVYPEGGTLEQLEVDCCLDCFQLRLGPWLAVNGAPLRKSVVDV